MSVTTVQEIFFSLAALQDSSRDTPMVKDACRAPRRAKKEPPTETRTKKRPLPLAGSATIEKDDFQEMASNVSVSKSRKVDIPTLVNRSLKDNFSTWGPQEVDLNLIDGISLRQQICMDKQRVAAGHKLAMGKLYYQTLRNKYSSAFSSDKQLQIANPSDPEDPGLTSALESMLGHRKCFDPMRQWLSSSQRPNQKVACCLLRVFLRYVKPSSSLEQTNLCLDLMRYCVRHQLPTVYSEEVAVVRRLFDIACCKSLAAYKSNGLSSLKWWQQQKDLAVLLVPISATEKCMAHTGTWDVLENELLEVVKSSELGQHLLWKASQAVLSARCTQAARNAVQTLLDKNITNETVVAARAGYEASMEKLNVPFGTTFSQRNTLVSYRGHTVAVPVMCYNDEFAMHLNAFLRSVAVVTKVLPPLWCEGELAFGATFDAKGTTVSADLAETSKAAREAAESMTSFDQADSGEAIIHLLSRKRSFFYSLDRHFIIESCFFNSFVGSSALCRLEAVVLDALPTKPGEEQLDSVLGKLQVIEKGKLVKFVGVGPDACFHVVLKLVQTIKDKRAPVWPATSTPFMDKVKARLALLCSVSKAGNASSKMEMLHGEAAALHLYTIVAANKTAGTVGTYAELTPLMVFGWLLSKDRQVQVKQWANQLLGGAGSALHTEVKEKTTKETKTKDATKGIVASLYA
jgi:hypothetical protein